MARVKANAKYSFNVDKKLPNGNGAANAADDDDGNGGGGGGFEVITMMMKYREKISFTSLRIIYLMSLNELARGQVMSMESRIEGKQ